MLTAPAPDPADDPLPGRRLGAYVLGREVGRGGMGAVYAAERADGAFDRRVAVKVIKRGLDTDALVHRFRREREILGSLEHPHIARLLDGGALPDGRPYLVMEYVDGEPLDAHCARRALPPAERLRLFAQVCDAVHFAHQRLVVHRDLKPANVFVAGDGAPRLLDFGLARLLDAGREDDGPPSSFGAGGGLTPGYASPEQVRGAPATVLDDVFALGALLRAAAGAGGVPLGRDVATIAERAAHAEPARRYASAEQLAEDVRRHLAGLPVRARPDAWGYRAGRFVRRHRLGVAAGALALAALAGGTGAAVRQARVARAERAAAERRFSEVRRLATVLLTEVHDSVESLPGSTPARELVVRRSLEYLDRLRREASAGAGDPALLGEVAVAYDRVGRIQGNSYYSHLGNSAGAAASYRQALALRARVAALRPGDPDALAALADGHVGVGDMHYTTNALGEAQASYRRALALREQVAALRPADPAAARQLGLTLTRLGDVTGLEGFPNLGDIPGALGYYRRALGAQERVAAAHPGEDAPAQELAITLDHLGMLERVTGDLPAAVRDGRRAVAVHGRLAAAAPGDQTRQFNALAAASALRYALVDEGRTAEALALSRSAAARLEAIVAADPKNAFARRSLGVVLNALGRDQLASGDRAGARATFGRSLGIARALLAADAGNAEHGRDVGFTLQLLAEARQAAGDARGALADYREAETISRALLAATPSANDRDDLANALGGAADALAALGDAPAALGAARQAAAEAERTAAASPANRGFQRRLAVRQAALGALLARHAAPSDAGAACAAHRRATAVWNALAASGALRPADTAPAAAARQAAARCR